MSEEVAHCPVCGETPEVSQLCVRLWMVKHEVNDDHLIRVIGKTRDEAVAKWNQMDKSSELPEWLKDKINAEIEIQLNECGLKAEALYWVLSLRRDQP